MAENERVYLFFSSSHRVVLTSVKVVTVTVAVAQRTVVTVVTIDSKISLEQYRVGEAWSGGGGGW